MLQTREIDLYLKRNTGPTYVPFVQYENGWALKINLKDVEIPASSSATIYVKKPSGLGVYNTATINSNSVTCEIDRQMLAEHGKASAQVQISKDELMISTFTVIFDIRQSVADGCEESHNESNVLQDFVDRAESAADTAETAVGQIGDSVEDAEAWAKGTRGGEPVSSDDPTYHNNSKYYADSVAEAGQYAEDAEAYAAGTRGGDPVESTDPAYHNNAAYYAGEAEDSATAAAGSASDAADAASTIIHHGKNTLYTFTLTSDNWSGNAQTVTAQGVLADEGKQLIEPVPASASMDAYISSGVWCDSQASNSLTFKCLKVPTSNLTVYVVVTEVAE